MVDYCRFHASWCLFDEDETVGGAPIFVSATQRRFLDIPRFAGIFADLALAADSHPATAMKRIIGMSVAAVVVVLQVAGFAAWRVEPAIYLAPIDGLEIVHQHA